MYMYVRMYIYIYACVCMYVHMCMYVYICMYVCITNLCTTSTVSCDDTFAASLKIFFDIKVKVPEYACMYVYMYVCMYVCVHVCIYQLGVECCQSQPSLHLQEEVECIPTVSK